MATGGLAPLVNDEAGIIEHQNTNHWGLLAPGAAFFRRVAFASLVTLAVLGSYLVMRQSDVQPTDATTIMAQHDATAVVEIELQPARARLRRGLRWRRIIALGRGRRTRRCGQGCS